MWDVTFEISPDPTTGGFVALWDDPQLSDSIRVEGATRDEARQRASDALINYIAYRGAAVEVDLRFVDKPALIPPTT